MTALPLLARYWREITGGVLVLIVGVLLAIHAHDRALLRACKAARLADQEAVRTRTAEAQAADLAHAREIETRNAVATQETERDYQAKLTAARAAAADYARRMRDGAQAVDRGGGKPGVPAPADAPGRAAGAGAAALVPVSADDLDTCTVNSAKAAAWLEWWGRVATPAETTTAAR